MPLIGDMPKPAEQSVSGLGSLAVIHAIAANVGEAARASRPVAPRLLNTLAFHHLATELIIRLLRIGPFDLG